MPSPRFCSCVDDSGETRAADAGDCPILPASSHWNRPVDNLPLVPNSDAIVASIGADEETHADFGSGRTDGAPIGIPYRTVDGDAEKVPVSFEIAEESDPGPYPIPRDAPIEGGPKGNGDRHVIVLDRSDCRVYETFNSFPQDGGKSWRADSGAVWDLRSNKLRKEGFTSADAAGLPIFPGLARPEEVKEGEIDHALRITVPTSRQEFIYPATHYASEDTSEDQPAMGQRLRIKRSVDPNRFPPQSRVLVRALQRYGAIVADNGSPWFISGVPSRDWNDEDLGALGRISGSDWEVVDVSGLSRPGD